MPSECEHIERNCMPASATIRVELNGNSTAGETQYIISTPDHFFGECFLRRGQSHRISAFVAISGSIGMIIVALL